MNFINIIICAYNEEESIERCIDSVKDTIDYCKRIDKGISVYIIDNESSDRTNELATRKASELENFSVIKIDHTSLSVSRNKYRDTDDSLYIAYIDADGSVEKKWLEQVSNFIDKNNVLAFGGRVKDIDGSGNLVYEIFYDQESVGDYIMGANMIINRKALDEIGGFPELFYSRGDESGMLCALSSFKEKADFGYDKSIVAYNAFDDSLINYLKLLLLDSQRHYILDRRYKAKNIIALKLMYKGLYILPFCILFLSPSNWPLFLVLPPVLAFIRKPRVICRQLSVLGRSKVSVFEKVKFSAVVLLSEFVVSLGYLKSIFKPRSAL